MENRFCMVCCVKTDRAEITRLSATINRGSNKTAQLYVDACPACLFNYAGKKKGDEFTPYDLMTMRHHTKLDI